MSGFFAGCEDFGGWEAGETITTETLRARRNPVFQSPLDRARTLRKTAFLRVLSVSVVRCCFRRLVAALPRCDSVTSVSLWWRFQTHEEHSGGRVRLGVTSGGPRRLVDGFAALRPLPSTLHPPPYPPPSAFCPLPSAFRPLPSRKLSARIADPCRVSRFNR